MAELSETDRLNRLLGLCARPRPNPEQQRRLRALAGQVVDWTGLPDLAERQGVGPLAHFHLKAAGVELPAPVRRALQGVYLQFRDANAVRSQALAELLAAFHSAGIDCMALKGGALAHLIYPEPGLRTMRDLDLLVRRADLPRARGVLEGLGYKVPPDDSQAAHYHHLPSASKRQGGVLVSVEVHYKLFPTTRYYTTVVLDDLLPRALAFDVAGQPALAPGPEDLFWYAYRHALGPPLLATPLRFIWLADLAGLAEQFVERLDWAQIARRCPAAVQALPMLQALSPWPEDIAARLPLRSLPEPAGLGQDYSGWPRRSPPAPLPQGEGASPSPPAPLPGGEGARTARLVATLWPGEWWLRLFYGAGDSTGYWSARLLRHPVHLLEWLVHFGLEKIRRPGVFSVD